MPRAATYVALALVGSAASLDAIRSPYKVRDLATRNQTSVYQTGLSPASRDSSSLTSTSATSLSAEQSIQSSIPASPSGTSVPGVFLSSLSPLPVRTTKATNTTGSTGFGLSTGESSSTTIKHAGEDLFTSLVTRNTTAQYGSVVGSIPTIATGNHSSAILNISTGYSSSISQPPPLATTAAALPSSNYTYISSDSLPSATVAPQRPLSNISNSTKTSSGFYPHVTAPNNPAGQAHYRPNETCGGATVNIVGASLDWWYTETYTHVDSTFVVQFDDKNSSTAWTLLPATEAFDITTAITNPTCVSSTGLNPEVNQTEVQFSCVDTPPPTAAATTTVEQTAYKDIDATTSRGDIPDVVTSPAPAAITVADDSATYSAGTPFVHFSRYEVVSKRPFNYANGMGCVYTTRVHKMESPGSFEYTGGDVDGAYAAVAGDLHQDVLGDLGEHGATAGSFVAEPTVVVVVEKIVAAARLMRGVLQQPQEVLEVPSATLPPGMSDVPVTPTEAGTTWAPVTARIEETASELAVPTPKPTRAATTTTQGQTVNAPFVAHVEGKDITLAIPVDRATPQPVVTAIFNGATVTATAVETSSSDSGVGLPGSVHSGPGNAGTEGSNRGENVVKIISALAGPAQPKNAAQVLSNAILTFGTPVGVGQAIASAMRGLPGDKPGQLAPVLTIGSSTFTASAAGGDGNAVIIAGQTLSAGGSPITVDGTVISLAPGATEIAVGSSTFKIDTTSNPGQVANIPLITIGSNTITANAATQFNLGGNILTPGGTVVVSGTTVSLEPNVNRIVIDGKAALLSPAVIIPAPLITFDGTAYQPNIGSTYDISSHFLTPGGAIIVSGTTISLPLTGTTLLINGLAQAAAFGGGVPANSFPTVTAPPTLHVNGDVYMPDGAAAYLISSQVLTPGGRITYTNPSGGVETVSLDASLHTLFHISGAQTLTSLLSPIGASPNGAAVLTIYGETYVAVAYSPGLGATYLIDGQTLTAGGSILYTLSSGEVQTISLLQPGTAIAIIDAAGHVSTSIVPGAYAVMPTSPPLLTLGSETFTAINPGATYVIDGATLMPDGDVQTVDVDGRTYAISLAAQATELMYSELGSAGGTMTEALFPARMTGQTFINEGSAAGGATQGSSAEGGGARVTGGSGNSERIGGNDTGQQNAASGFEMKSWILSGCLAWVSFCLAVWL